MLNTHPSPKLWLATLALLVCTFALAAPAQADPAGRIGRIAWLSGNVQLNNPSTGESFNAPLNQPLTSGDILITEPNTRTEIQIGSMTLRLDGSSRLEINRINDEQVAVYLAEGRAIAKLSSPDSLRDFSLETRNGRFSARETGVFRFEAEANTSSATAYIGTLHMENANQSFDIRSGQRAQFGDGEQGSYRLASANNDNFSQWSAARDQRSTANTYTRYVSPEMTGAEDLDAYGNWSQTPEYGAIWTPRAVAADWAPYRSGQWVWVAPWGWNWVGNEPWGFAPFHYGRWVQHHGNWGWVPGARIARPVYAPAMVAWVGTPGFGVSISIGSAPTVGWFPLGPREVYVPSYRSSTNYVRNVNVTHVTNITNINNIVNNPQGAVQHTRYMYRDAPRAMTVVPSDVIMHHRPVGPAALSYNTHHGLRDQPLQAGAPVAAPRNEARGDLRTNPERRDDRGRTSPDREQGRPQPGIAATAQVQASPPERNDRPQRDDGNRFEPTRQNEQHNPGAATRPVAQANSATLSTRSPEQREPSNRDLSRREREPAKPVSNSPISAPDSVSSRDAMRPGIAAAPQTPEVNNRRNERPSFEALQTTAPSRVEAAEPRSQERPMRREEPVTSRPQREIRVEAAQLPTVAASQRTERPTLEPARPQRSAEPVAMPQQREVRSEPVQQQRQAAFVSTSVNTPARTPARAEAPAPAMRETRHEAPREVSRPTEQRAEAKAQRQEERQRPAQNEKSQERHKRDEGDKR